MAAVLVEEGSPAPDFTLTSDSGEQVSLESLRGKPVVLYFYPKDDTPGCTAQACGIRDAWGDFERSGAVVLGVSPDSPKKHAKFRDKYGLPFTLLADEDHSVSEKYGVWVEKSFAGSRFTTAQDCDPPRAVRRASERLERKRDPARPVRAQTRAGAVPGREADPPTPGYPRAGRRADGTPGWIR